MRRFAVLIFLLIACQENEADIPVLVTLPAQQLGTDRAVLEAEIKEVGPIRPIDFGFIWSIQPDMSIVLGQRIYAGSTSDPQKYSILLESLLPATTYYYMSYAANQSYTQIYYGPVVSFTTLP